MAKVFNIINGAFFAILVSSIQIAPLSAYADKYKIMEDEPLCHEIYSGGINWFDDEHAVQRGEIEDLEQKVIATGEYVLVNTDAKKITDTTFNDLYKSCIEETTGCNIFYFATFLNPENIFYDTYSKVYLYKPVFEEYIEAYRNGTLENNPYLTAEMEESTVIIDYGVPYFSERIGADLSDEVDDGIPEWYKTGFLRVESPVSVMITLELMEEKNYYTFYVEKEKPFYIKLKQGGYFVVQVNEQETGDGEETLPYHDLIQITPDNESKENAYLLQLQAFAEKYNIQDFPDPKQQEIIETRNIYEDPFAEKTTVETDVPELSEISYQNIPFKVILGIFGIGVVLLTAITHFKKKSRYPNGEKGDEYDKTT